MGNGLNFSGIRMHKYSDFYDVLVLNRYLPCLYLQKTHLISLATCKYVCVGLLVGFTLTIDSKEWSKGVRSKKLIASKSH